MSNWPARGCHDGHTEDRIDDLFDNLERAQHLTGFTNRLVAFHKMQPDCQVVQPKDQISNVFAVILTIFSQAL